MAKQRRGKGIIDLPGKGKGKCPICGRTNIKLLWESTNDEGNEMKVCKACRNK